MTRAPAEQWWVINGAEVLRALRQAQDGGDPERIYLELFANSHPPAEGTT